MNILVADDHQLVLEGICSCLRREQHSIILSCSNGIDAWNGIRDLRPDVAMLDHSMPGMTGLQIAENVFRERLPTKIVLLTIYAEKELVDKARAIGVMGYILKDDAMNEIPVCLECLGRGSSFYSRQLTRHLARAAPNTAAYNTLTHAERKVLRQISLQKTSKAIAEELQISIKTVEKHRSELIRKLQLPSTGSSLAVWASKNIV